MSTLDTSIYFKYEYMRRLEQHFRRHARKPRVDRNAVYSPLLAILCKTGNKNGFLTYETKPLLLHLAFVRPVAIFGI